MSKLSEAKRVSDDLINLENIAMNTVKGLYGDDGGRFTIKGDPDMAMARNLLFGKKYHEAKARIMKPIEQFFTLLEWRMTNDENQLHRRNEAIIFGISILVTITIGFSIYVFFLWNDQAVRITGYSSEEMLGRKCTEFALNPCTQTCGLLSSDITKPFFDRECTIKTKIGQIRFIKKNVSKLSDINGAIIGGIECFEDITEHREMEIALKKNEERLLEAAKIANLGYFELDLRTMTFTLDNLLWGQLGTSIEEEGGKAIGADRYLN